jgi:hypothetical protein
MNDGNEMKADCGDVLRDGVRGKYFDEAKHGVKAILLDADVAEVFPEGKQINEILRSLIPTLRGKRPDIEPGQ